MSVIHLEMVHTGAIACGRAAKVSTLNGHEVTCKTCRKSNAGVQARATTYSAPTLFEVETEATANSEEAPAATVVVLGEADTFTLPVLVPGEPVEAEVEAPVEGPTQADMDALTASHLEDILTGYSEAEWLDIMLSADTHTVGMSRGVAVERLYMEKQAGKRARKFAAETARVMATIDNATRGAELSKLKGGATYAAMSALLPELRARRVVLTLTGKSVTVDSVKWEKGEGWVSSTVATFTVVKGLYIFKLPSSKGKGKTRVERLDFEQAVQCVKDLTEKRGADIMPRGFRAVMRTHRAKNSTPGDITGNRATRAVALEVSGGDELSAADLEKYPALAMVSGPRLTKTGFENMQGVALTAGERRERDRARLKAWREAKRAEKRAEQA